MTWASILAGFVKLANLVMGYLGNKQLLDAREARADARYLEVERDRLDTAMRARIDADDGGVRDPFDAANRRDV